MSLEEKTFGKDKTCIKFCGLTRLSDIEAANELCPEYVGFVFWEKSKRCVTREKALELKKALLPGIKAVGVFVDEEPEKIAALLTEGIIDIAQLHGNEDEEYIERLRKLIVDKPIIKAFVVKGEESTGSGGANKSEAIRKELSAIKVSSADYLLLDSGKGTGQTFNWELIREAGLDKPFFLAGGLVPENVELAIETLHPYAVDVSSGIETDGLKDPEKMRRFAANAAHVITRGEK